MVVTMRKSVADLTKVSGSLGVSWLDTTTKASEFAALTLVTSIELDFLYRPWQGARYIAILADHTASIFYDPSPCKLPTDVQQVAARFREMSQEIDAVYFACVVNLDATPTLPGSLGPLFGFQVLISVVGSELRIKPYDASSGELEFRGTLRSAMNTQWEHTLGEPIEKFLNRLFIPLAEI